MFSLGRRKVVFFLSLFLFFCKYERSSYFILAVHDFSFPTRVGFVFLYSHHIFTSSEAINFDRGIVQCNNACQTYYHRLDAYCHRTLLNLSMQLHLAQEGHLVSKGPTLSNEFKLVHAHVMIRHGDRTPVYTFKIGSTVFYECGLVDSRLDWDGLSDFPDIEPLPPSAQLQNEFLKLHPGVNTRRCSVGMLTQMGFKQHRSLGALLQTKYKNLLDGFFSATYSPRDVYAQSTDMPRTMQSAAAFLVGFLPNNTSIRQATKIHVSPGTINHKPPPGVERIYPSCHGSYDFLDKDLKKSGYYTTEKMVFHPLLERLCKMFHIPVPHQPIVARLFDHFMTRGCHNRDDPLPCFRGDCVSFDYALKLFDFNDWNWSHKLPDDSSVIRLLPFLRHSVLEPMLKVAAREDKKSYGDDQDPYSFKFMLTLSHDDTLMMVLNALGYRLDRWIPYASRIAFELWKKTAPNADSGYYVRVLFNGETITERTFPARKDGSGLLLDGQLVPLHDWRDFLSTGKYRDLTTYNKVCKN